MTVTQKDREDAEMAYRILTSSVFIGAVKKVEHGICSRWKGELSPQEREALWHDLQSLYRVRLCLLRTLEDVAFSTKDNVFLNMLNKIRKVCRG